jgi:hypothetical protein
MSSNSMSGALVRVVVPPHEGMVVCPDHLREVDDIAIYEEIPASQVSFWGYRCLMCGVTSVPDRVCGNEECGKPLHPQWPAIYCCDLCALEDV